jgi:alpha-beta hydrolase superfamily lysophospholipase
VRFAVLLSMFGLAMLAAPVAASAADYAPDSEAANFGKIRERFQYDAGTPEYRALAAQTGAESELEYAQIQATDPERAPLNPCAHRGNECNGDARFYGWGDQGSGLVRDILFTARDGATLSGKVWATAAGPAKRPGIVITTGSVQAPETLYWPIAANLAKRGYVVLTYDVQGQGRSDTFGEEPDRQEGVPSQAGQPFYDGTEDALDFFLSTPAAVFRPRPSCSTGTSHDSKQQRRVKAGLNSAYNPFWDLVDTDRIGIAGHSLGAAAVSFVGQKDPRVDAVVAWDNLRAPTGSVPACASAPATRTAPSITKPALGMSNDYGLTPTPFTSAPDPDSKLAAFTAYKAAGVDVAQLNIRGGTHYEYSYIGMPEFPATLRGMDMAVWYTGAWFDKYVAGDATADRRLLTGRWRADRRGAEVDSAGDGNLFSFYSRSPLSVGLAGGERAECSDLRPGCAALVPDDGEPADFSYLKSGLTRDAAGAGSPPGTTPGASGPRTRTVKVRIPKRLSLVRSRRSLAIRLTLPAKATVVATVRTTKGKRIATRTKRYAAGAHTLAVRLPAARSAPGKLKISVVVALPGGPAARVTTVRVTK